MTPERELRLREVAVARQAGFIVLLEDIHDPHNAEAILRTCDAFGVHDVWFVFDKEEPYNPKRIGKSSSSSANKWLALRTFKERAQAVAELRREGYVIAATTLAQGAMDPYRSDLSLPRIALVVGNEHRGVSDALLREADIRLSIPMRGMVESLNVSVAAALLIAESTRQRLDKGGFPLRSDEEIARIFNDLKGR